MLRRTIEEGQSAAGLNSMEFPALRRNPFLKENKDTTVQTLSRFAKEGATLNKLPSPKLQLGQSTPQHNTSPLNLSPLKKANNLTVNSNGLTSCFTAETIHNLMEENPSFLINSDANSHSRNSAVEPKSPDENPNTTYQRREHGEKEKNHNRKASVNKQSHFRSHKSKGKESESRVSRERSVVGSKGGSLMKSQRTGASPLKKSPLKVFQDFMKDV